MINGALLVEILPLLEHNRTSCSDENVANFYTTAGRGGYPRCPRCAVLKAIEDSNKYPIVELDIRVKVPNRD